MTKKAAVPFKPVKIPSGFKLRLEQRYKGIFRQELDALQFAGISPELDLEALKAGRLSLTFDWPLDDKTTLHLKAVYPDAFPNIRPQVFLLSGLDKFPDRHCSPMEGNLCLLGRDSGQWMPSWTLHKLLTKQLEDSIRGTGEEDPQGEPADYWWNGIGPKGACCLIDSSWNLSKEDGGTLLVRYVIAEHRKVSTDSGIGTIPILRGVVIQVRDARNKGLYDWQGALPPDLRESNKLLTVPWVRLEEELLPRRDLGEQIEEIRQAHTWLQRGRPHPIATNLMVDPFAVVFPSQLGFNDIGTGWAFFTILGRRNSFKANANKKKPAKKKNPLTATTLPTYRAGLEDIGHRVPAVQLLHKKKILVVGIGAVGAPVVVELARNNCGILHLIEHDVVEPGNTIRWPLGTSAWAHPKLEALIKFLNLEYPATKVRPHPHYLGLNDLLNKDSLGDDDVLDSILPEVDLVVDGSASHGVTTLLAERCKQFGLPLISLFATPTLEGGAVVRHSGGGGCPICLEWAWHSGKIAAPPGRGRDDSLTQPPGCAERTFIGAGYDLQELSLQAVRLIVETLSQEEIGDSLIQTLSFIDDKNHRCPPSWRVEPLPKHPECGCRS